MADHPLDALLSEVGQAIARVRADLRERQRARWRRGFGGEAGVPPLVDVPTLTAEGWSTRRVPVHEVLGRRELTVPSVRVEIRGALRRLPPGRGSAQRIALYPDAARGVHTLRIDVPGADGEYGEVRLDGVLLRRMAAEPGPWRGEAARRRIGWPRRGLRLVLEDEDARQALEAFGASLRAERMAALRRRCLATALSVALLALLVLGALAVTAAA